MRLHVRLAAGSALLLMAAAVPLAFWLTRTAARFEAEVAQRLNAGIAMYVTQELQLIDSEGVNKAALAELAHRVMTVNPSAEVYLLDDDGNIVSTLVAPERIRRHRVDLQPIKTFLAGPIVRFIAGTDPTRSAGNVPFSVAPLSTSAGSGYLYVVLGGSRFESAVAAVRESYSLQTGVAVVAAILLVAIVLGALLFRALTLPLRELTQRMQSWAAWLAESEHRRVADSNDEFAALNEQFEQMARRIELQMEQIRSRDRQRREFIANVSHDLRTPLTSLHGSIETIVLKAATMPLSMRDQHLQTALHHSKRLQQLISSLFELSRLEVDAQAPASEVFSLAELMQDIAQRFRLRAQAQRVQLIVDDHCATAPVCAHLALIERLFENLLDNALRHTPQDGVIELHCRLLEQRLVVEVSDTGVGMPHSSTSEADDLRMAKASPRTGFGLAIVRRIVEMHAGTLQIESAPNAGTTVRFDLPLAARQGGDVHLNEAAVLAGAPVVRAS